MKIQSIQSTGNYCTKVTLYKQYAFSQSAIISLITVIYEDFNSFLCNTRLYTTFAVKLVVPGHSNHSQYELDRLLTKVSGNFRKEPEIRQADQVGCSFLVY